MFNFKYVLKLNDNLIQSLLKNGKSFSYLMDFTQVFRIHIE